MDRNVKKCMEERKKNSAGTLIANGNCFGQKNTFQLVMACIQKQQAESDKNCLKSMLDCPRATQRKTNLLYGWEGQRFLVLLGLRRRQDIIGRAEKE
ncbi:hypothetical protein L5515_017258 [Caenorhabditis briggsae]|uniref:Uncharacterized protein n=1 Tax=Caenorhabditis briggsae TaxID=6238 RepID=A0AAE9JSE3_CAEBR|nr:hypothetical protein L5515_017258 [Caenorhabditis briggsae]